MVRLLCVWCAFMVWGYTSVEAVSLRIETAVGDSVFFASAGDTVSVALRVDSEGQVLTGVEVFLQYDPRAFAQADTVRPALLFGRVLVDTHRVLSDSVAVVHFAEADLIGKTIDGVLFEADFAVLDAPAQSSFQLLSNAPLYQSAYTTLSAVGETIGFENVHGLVYGDFPPQLTLPPFLTTKEDNALVINLKTWATDAESGDALVWSVVPSSDRVVAEVTDSLTVVLTPAENFSGQVSLALSVTDGSLGQTKGEVVLNVASVNDAPHFVAGVLPDSVVLDARNVVVSLVGAAVDVEGDALVWTGQGTGNVGVEIVDGTGAQIFASLDWVGEATVFVFVGDGKSEVVGHSILVMRQQALNALPGDFDGNGEVGFPDFLAFAQAFGQDNPSSEADLNGDGRVDFADFVVFAQNFGRTS